MANTNTINNKPDANRTAKAIVVYGTSGALSELGPLTNGQLIIGSTGNAPSANTLASSDSTILITNGAGTVNLETSFTVGSSGFLAYNDTNRANATGDATAATLPCNAEVYDIAANYNNGTYIFTSPVTGKYYLDVYSYINGMGAGHTAWLLQLITSNRTYNMVAVNGGYIRSANAGGFTGGGSAVTDMDAADTAYGQITVSNSTKTCTIETGSNGNIFSGLRIF